MYDQNLINTKLGGDIMRVSLTSLQIENETKNMQIKYQNV